MTTYLPKLLVTGSNGQLAQALRFNLLSEKFNIKFCTRSELDITQSNDIESVFASFQPDYVINTAAYTAVDLAETAKTEADAINHQGPALLASICEQYHIPLIHFSTDYIFDGERNSAYQEEDPANPINYYGETKWLGEEAIRKNCQQHLIIRISGVFSEYGKNFLKTIRQLSKEKKLLNIVADQVICPTDANDIANTTYQLLTKEIKWGTYHFSSCNATTWYDFAKCIVDEAKKIDSLTIAEVNAIPTIDYPTPAKRPAFSVLNCDKIQRDYDLSQPHWEHAIKRLLIKLKG